MGKIIKDSFLDELKKKVNIVSIVKDFCPDIKSAGNNEWKALCPFHKEKTPSFLVSSYKQIFWCVGCDEKGDVFYFVKKIKKCSLGEAVRYVAEKNNIKIEFYEDESIETFKEKLMKTVESDKPALIRALDSSFFQIGVFIRTNKPLWSEAINHYSAYLERKSSEILGHRVRVECEVIKKINSEDSNTNIVEDSTNYSKYSINDLQEMIIKNLNEGIVIPIELLEMLHFKIKEENKLNGK